MILNQPLAAVDFIAGMVVGLAIIAALWGMVLIVRAVWRGM